MLAMFADEGRRWKELPQIGRGMDAARACDKARHLSAPYSPIGSMPPQKLRGGHRVLRFPSEIMVKVVIMPHLMQL
jgi:hypothetical protein